MPSVRESILANVKTTLQGIAPGGIPAAGYTTAVKQVFRWGTSPVHLLEFPVVTFSDVAEKYADPAMVLHDKFLTVVVAGWHKIEFESDDTVAAATTSFLADLEKAIKADPKRGGYAITTTLKSNDMWLEEEQAPLLGLSLTFDVHYRTSTTDPASLTP